MKKIDLANLDEMREINILEWGKTLVVAPHPDDESLGCGGAIRLLRENGREVRVLVLSDGTQSHPNSKKFPPEKLRDLREKEIIEALDILGVSKENVEFFRYKDRSVPNETAENWRQIVEKTRAFLSENEPQTVLVPWRRDPHPDHRAAFALINALKIDFPKMRVIEYPIWLWEIAESEDAPLAAEVAAIRLNIGSVKKEKKRAIYRHASQTSGIIDDDPECFQLSAQIIEKFLTDWEIYLEEI